MNSENHPNKDKKSEKKVIKKQFIKFEDEEEEYYLLYTEDSEKKKESDKNAIKAVKRQEIKRQILEFAAKLYEIYTKDCWFETKPFEDPKKPFAKPLQKKVAKEDVKSIARVLPKLLRFFFGFEFPGDSPKSNPRPLFEGYTGKNLEKIVLKFLESYDKDTYYIMLNTLRNRNFIRQKK